MSFQKGYKQTEETKRKIREYLKGKPKSEEHKRNMSLCRKGKKPSEEHIQKIKDNAKINPNYGMKGKHHKPETIQKMKEAKLGNKYHLGKHHTPESIQKYKEKRAKFILPKEDTSIELKIQNYLKELGIEFFTHQYMKIEHGYQCDVFIPSLNMVIECDGNYWHKYPTGTDIDHIRTQELIANGFKVLRLWEINIVQMSLEEFKEIMDKTK